jgi:hypothetical protein
MMTTWLPLEEFDDYTTAEQKEALLSWLGTHAPEDWHLVVSAWNWDNGSRIVMWILRQPDCDRATVQLGFWLNDPSDVFADKATYDRYHSANAGDSRVAICTELLERWRAGLYVRSEILMSADDLRTVKLFREAYEENTAKFEPADLVWSLPDDFTPALSGRVMRRRPPYEILPL